MGYSSLIKCVIPYVAQSLNVQSRSSYRKFASDTRMHSCSYDEFCKGTCTAQIGCSDNVHSPVAISTCKLQQH